METTLQILLAHNVWATQKLIDACKALTAEQFHQRFEIGLRGFAPRIERLRREVPARYELYIRTLGIYVRDARSKALEPMFGNAVRPDEP